MPTQRVPSNAKPSVPGHVPSPRASIATHAGGAHVPSSATSVPAARALHALQYSAPSQPHTPGQSRGQPVGRGLQMPLPQLPSAISQYSSAAQGSVGLQLGAHVTSGQPAPSSHVMTPPQPGQQSSPGAQVASPHETPASSLTVPPSVPASVHASSVQDPPGGVQMPQLALQHTSPTSHVTAPHATPRAPSLPASPPAVVPPHALAPSRTSTWSGPTERAQDRFEWPTMRP